MLSYLLSFCVLQCSLFALCYDTATCPHQQINLRTSLHISTWWWPCMPYHTHSACSPGYAMMHMCTCPLVSTHALVYLGQKSLAPQDYTYLAHLRYILILMLNQLQCDSVGLWAVHEGWLAVDHRAFMAWNLLSLHPASVWPVRLLSRAFTQWSFKSCDLFSKQN